nr:MAG: hypothetical protein J07AB56_11850 [Candidatus Nanosalinarum sp. J07AB56]
MKEQQRRAEEFAERTT